MNRKQKKEKQKRVFLDSHIPHRLTLLRTFRERQKWFEDHMTPDPNCHPGDLLRCSKDSALITIRMFAEFLGLKVHKDGSGCDRSCKKSRCTKKWTKESASDNDDIDLSWFFDDQEEHRLLWANVEPESDRQILRAVIQRANKELAHLTSIYDYDANTAKAIIRSITLVERLVKENLFDRLEPEVALPNQIMEIRRNHYFLERYDGIET